MSNRTNRDPEFDLVVIGGSAGALDPLITVIKGLPASFDAAVLVVTHRPAENRSSNMIDILSWSSKLPVVETEHGMRLERGRVHVARANVHLDLVEQRVVELDGPKSRHWRPAIDDVFQTMAETYGNRLIAVILSGAMDDGVEGLSQVWEYGGTTIVQDPNEAQFSSMPNMAILRDHPNVVAPAADIPATLRSLLGDNRQVAHADDDGVTVFNPSLAN